MISVTCERAPRRTRRNFRGRNELDASQAPELIIFMRAIAAIGRRGRTLFRLRYMIGARASPIRLAWPSVIMLPRMLLNRGSFTPETMYCQR